MKSRAKSAKRSGLRAQKKCCRSTPRCARCPRVLHAVQKAELNGVRGKELDKVVKRVRKA